MRTKVEIPVEATENSWLYQRYKRPTSVAEDSSVDCIKNEIKTNEYISILRYFLKGSDIIADMYVENMVGYYRTAVCFYP